MSDDDDTAADSSVFWFWVQVLTYNVNSYDIYIYTCIFTYFYIHVYSRLFSTGWGLLIGPKMCNGIARNLVGFLLIPSRP